MDAGTIGLFYVAPLALWVIFLAVVGRVLSGKSLEDSFAYLVILKRRRTQFVAMLILLAVSQITKDAIQVAWSVGSLSDTAMLVPSIVLNVVSAGAVVGLAWALLRKASLTPEEDRVLSSTAEAMYAMGKPAASAGEGVVGGTWEPVSRDTIPTLDREFSSRPPS
jgi:hypothetical protein